MRANGRCPIEAVYAGECSGCARGRREIPTPRRLISSHLGISRSWRGAARCGAARCGGREYHDLARSFEITAVWFSPTGVRESRWTLWSGKIREIFPQIDETIAQTLKNIVLHLPIVKSVRYKKYSTFGEVERATVSGISSSISSSRTGYH